MGNFYLTVGVVTVLLQLAIAGPGCGDYSKYMHNRPNLGAGNSRCNCAGNYNPVCGSDGVTYLNPCQLQWTVQSIPGLTQKKCGPCSGVAACHCPSDPDASVCGQDKNTYKNLCRLNCASVPYGYAGNCTPAPAVCNCVGRPPSPVCASDNKQYVNECEFNCAKISNPSLTIRVRGPCLT